MTIQVLILLTGQSVIGDVEQLAETYYVQKPAVIVADPRSNPNSDAGIKLGLAPWPELADVEDVKKNGVHINKNVVVTVTKPLPQLLKGYQATMSGLVLPQTPMLLKE